MYQHKNISHKAIDPDIIQQNVYKVKPYNIS